MPGRGFEKERDFTAEEKAAISAREREVLGRAITKDEAREFVACKASFYRWQKTAKSAMVPTPVK